MPRAPTSGTIQPWVEAKIGPQLVSAYVDTVLVRPGAVVKRGEVLATLDCRNASAQPRRSRCKRARSRPSRRRSRTRRRASQSSWTAASSRRTRPSRRPRRARARPRAPGDAGEAAAARRSRSTTASLRAPFDGEVATRTADPGRVRAPGHRSGDARRSHDGARRRPTCPRRTSTSSRPATPVHIVALATNRELAGTIARRAPAADPSTRTVHFEIDVPDPDRTLPVGTTAELAIDVGRAGRRRPRSRSSRPSVRGRRRRVFVVEGDVAQASASFVLRASAAAASSSIRRSRPAAQVVTEGRALLRTATASMRCIETGQPEPTVEAAPGASRDRSRRSRTRSRS